MQIESLLSGEKQKQKMASNKLLKLIDKNNSQMN